jgi:hypothetical protein
MVFSDEKTLPVVWMKNSPYYIATAVRQTPDLPHTDFTNWQHGHFLSKFTMGGIGQIPQSSRFDLKIFCPLCHSRNTILLNIS